MKAKEHLEQLLTETKQEIEVLDERLEDKPINNLGEGDVGTYAWKKSRAQRERAEAKVEALEQALARVDQGTYGICADCGQAIEQARLELLPTTLYCAECAPQHQPAILPE